MRKQHRTGRIAILLALLLCAVFLRPAYAEDIEGDFPYETSGLSGKPEDNSFSYVYRDSFFSTSSYEMNPDLARLAMRLAVSGFGTGENSEATTLLSMFDCLGIKCTEETVHYGIPGPDTIGYAYGVRDISDDEVLIVAVVRGGNYQKEWAGNFTLGRTKDHEGFRACADIIVEDLSEYIRKMPAGKKVSLLMTGYSRGAAVCNLAAASLDELASEADLGAAAPENIYAYCFACPMNTRRTETASQKLYANIFSFVHPADPVPKVAPGDWGYGRFGTTYLLPTEINDDDYDTYHEEFASLFCKYSLAEVFPIKASNIVKMDRAISAAASTLMSPTVYVLTVQDSIRKAFLGEGDDNSVLSSIFGDAGEPGNPVGGAIILNSPFVAHAPELYLAALDAIGDGSRLQNVRTDYNYFTCESDASILVYDCEGNLVLIADDKKVSTGEDAPAFGAEYELGTFLFDCPSTETYYAVFVPEEDKQKLTLKCGRFDSLASKDAMQNEYNKLKLKKDECAVLVLSPEAPVLYITSIDAAEQLTVDLMQGKTPDIEPVEPSKVTVSEQNPSDVPEDPTPTPSPEPTEAVATPGITDTPDVTPTGEPTPEATPTSGQQSSDVTPTGEPTPDATPTETEPAPTLTPNTMGDPSEADVTPSVTETPAPTDPPAETDAHRDPPDKGNTPGWIIPVVCAAAGLCVVSIITAFLLKHRRKKADAPEPTSEQDN
ncbi:MAG: hypothetical protein J5649_09175 [Lachnospiraceae bacterium]|nr:hypothetical protein [Lachnospiraceae bacterium]